MTWGDLYVNIVRVVLMLTLFGLGAGWLIWTVAWIRYLALSYLPWPP